MASRFHSLILALAASAVAGYGHAQPAPYGPEGAFHPPMQDGPDGGCDGGHDGGGGWMPGRHHHGGPFAEPGWEFHALDLTPEQRRRMQIIVLNARLQVLQQPSGTAGRDDWSALLNPGDPNYGAAVQEAKKRAADHIQRMSDLRQQLYNVLTPEQKSEFARRVEQRKARMAARHGQEDSKGPPDPAAR